MDPTEKRPPLVFANRVIRLMVDHTGGEEMVTLPEDFRAIRVTFRYLKGSWQKIALGDIVQTRLLRKVVEVWCKQPSRRKDNEYTELV